ncbi:MAG: EamA family transporter [Candidatus Nanohalobium sp.]
MIELGLMLAAFLAFMKGFQSVYERKGAVSTDEFVTAWASRAFGVPVLLAAVLIQDLPPLSTEFFIAVIPQSLAITAASVIIAKAFKESDASIVTPMFALSPVLVLITSFVVLGEVPSLSGVIGVGLVAAGAYSMKIEGSQHVLQPFRRLWSEKGVQLILTVIMLYSVTSVVDKIGVKSSSPAVWSFSVVTLSSIFLFPVMTRKSGEWRKKLRTDWKPLTFLGGIGGAAAIVQMTAIKLTLVTYVISIKRLSIPLTVILSYLLLGEKESIKGRLLGAALMTAGALMIIL